MIRNDLPRALVDNPRLDRWIGFEPGGRVRLATGKVEIGQGILTALLQLAAEELEVAPTRVRVVSGDTAETPDEGTTAGSLSVETSGHAIRLVAAEVRALLLARAAARLGCAPASLTVEDGHILRDGKAAGLDYWALAPEIDLARPPTGSAPLRRASAFRVAGTSLRRLDLPAKLTGAPFIHDIVQPDMLHARMLRPVRHGAALASLDATRLAPADLVRCGGLAAVVAAREADALRALAIAQRIATWQGGLGATPADADPHTLPTLPSRDADTVAPGTAPGGHPAMTVEATYARPYIAHASIGLCCALARFASGILEVWTHSQGVGPLRHSIARALHLDPAAVTVRHRQGSGCYGHNGADDVAMEAAALAMARPGRTIRVLWTREDELSAGPCGAAGLVRLRASLDQDGHPLDWTMEIWSPPHAARPGMNGALNLAAAPLLPGNAPDPEPVDVPDAGGGGGTRNSVALYDLPPQRRVHHMVPAPPLRCSALRGLGAQVNVLAIESFMDELALAAGQDPVQYRLDLMTDPRARAVMVAAADMCGWAARGPGGDGQGLGFGFSRYKNRAAYLAAGVSVTVEQDVRVGRIWCAVDAGLVVNPDGAANQVEGGAVQAVSWVLKEQIRTDDQGIATRSWADYPVLRFSETPEVDIRFIGSAEDPPLGMGEVALGPVTAAIANAVAHALGTRIRDLPLSRERIMAALLQAG